MPNYRRWRVEGGVYFFTVVAHQRRKILTLDSSRPLLRDALQGVQDEFAFEQMGFVLLPDHLHVLWRLPKNDSNYSLRLGAVKRAFTCAYLAAGGREGAVSEGRRRQRARGVWQLRFLEHTIRDFDDFRHHLDYIHTNPVKHGYVEWPREWPWSSFHRYAAQGFYDEDWCGPIDVTGMTHLEPDGL